VFPVQQILVAVECLWIVKKSIIRRKSDLIAILRAEYIETSCFRSGITATTV
jgi:hypothetical protein